MLPQWQVNPHSQQENRRWPLYQNLPSSAGTASTSWVDLQRLQLVLDALPDEPLMQLLLAMALGRIRAGQPEHLRSLIKPA